jgi:outer membrane protein OmpA-like peptidoglycan-associated protein
MQYLIEQGIEPQRIRLGSAGAYEPVEEGLDPLERERNARVEVLMWDERASDPSEN